MRSFLTAVLLAGLSSGVQADGLGDLLKQVTKEPSKSAVQSADTSPAGPKLDLSGLTNNEMVAGLKETLSQGVSTAIEQLGKEDGFLSNAAVKIPLPSALKSLQGTLKKVGQEQLATDLELAMNRAAEKAVPEAAKVLGNAIEAMSVEDAVAILQGKADAATDYFRRATSEELTQKFLPIVKQATDNTGVSSTYKTLSQQISSVAGPLAGMLGGNLDLDQYVTDKSLDGLFQVIAEEEKRIRQDPVARGTDLLKKIFGE